MCEAATACGVPYVTVRWHIANDPGFAAAVDGVHKEFVERAKGYMLQHMARPGNYMDRVTIARRYEPGVWGDYQRVQLDVNVTHVTEALDKAKALEAEVSGLAEETPTPPPSSSTLPSPCRAVKKL